MADSQRAVLAPVKDCQVISLVDSSMNDRATRFACHTRRFFCPDALCPTRSFGDVEARIGFPRPLATDRAGPYGGVCNRTVEKATPLAEPFHVTKLTNVTLGE